MRQAGVEMLIWSSRLLLPAAVATHLLFVWRIAPASVPTCLVALLAPGLAEAAWIAWHGWQSAAGRVVLLGGAAMASLVLLLGLGMVVMSRGDRRRPMPTRAADRL